jgi:Amt family ammonium transporter
LRLPHGDREVEVAADFLPQAERYNLMPEIDRWVVRETIALLGQWRREHPEAELPVCSINLSASALLDDSLLLWLEEQLARREVPAGGLCFEIPESAVLNNLARSVRVISALRSSGCGVALDDVGDSLTSLTYLKTLQVDFLKIGGHLVGGIVGDPMHGSIVGAINLIGRSMGINTIAKQVDSDGVLQRLRMLDIGYAQGRALASPAPLIDTDGRVMLRSLPRSA